MMNEERELMNNGLDINIFEKQIDLAIEYGINSEKRSEIMLGLASAKANKNIKDFFDNP